MSPQDAVDIILDIFKTAWEPRAAFYEDVPGSAPTSEQTWARASVKHSDGNQTSMGSATGTRKFTDQGTVFVQVFSPVGDGSTASREAAKDVLNAFRDARDPSVWFRNAKLNEVGSDGAFYQTNVSATFSYDTVR